jgi:DNA polymerase-3 subunit alpha
MIASTSGFLVYQEQVIQFLHEFCGYTMGEADIVRRHFAKKTGTDEDIPQIHDGFIKTMKEKYNTSEEEAEKIIGDFLRVIEDASNYLFSLNHALPYSYIGYICGYLRYYYPLEFLTSALNIFESKPDDTARVVAYAKKVGIEIKGIQFGKSESGYTMDKNNNCIYKGIASIKYCNGDIATELLNLSKNHYNNFIDLLQDIYTQTSLNSRQLNILIGLNFFSEFGKNKYLMDIVDIYNKFGTCKIINKNNLESFNTEYGLTEFMLNK